jgi:membrane protein YqaA with SNARE-associated domain
MFNYFADWRAWGIVLTLAALTLILSVAKYRVGQAGFEALTERFPQVSSERWEKVGNYFKRWGAPVVFFSFLPVLGIIIPPAAGAYGIRFGSFLIFAFLAKVVRYWLLLLLVVGGFRTIF